MLVRNKALRKKTMTTFFILVLLSVILLSNLVVSPAAALDIVQNGHAACAIVVPDQGLPVVRYAAEELQYHVKEATGASLPILTESQNPPKVNLIYLGACQATHEAGIHTDGLASNSFRIKLIGSNLFIVGDDSDGPVLGVLHRNSTRVGTLFGVYEFLDTYMGVRWLWPGKRGEVIPRRSDIAIARWDQTWQPPLLHSRLRDYHTAGIWKDGWNLPQVREDYLKEQSVWMRRHRFARGVSLDYGHGFEDYWKRFGESHPEYFNLLPDGTRRPDPNLWNGQPRLVSLSLSEPELWKQIVKDWKSRPKGDEPWLNLCLNDTATKCLCEKCLAWDVPDPNHSAPLNKRLEMAKEAFFQGDRHWEKHLGSLSDRCAKFYLAVQREAEKTDPDVTVIALAYQNYTLPPLETRLNERIIIHGVLDVGWRSGFEDFRKQWEGWAATGVRLSLRPNSFLEGHNMPLIFVRQFGQCFSYAFQNSMIGTDFDSLTGQWATQGPNLYALGRMHTRGDWSIDDVLDEYYQAFGPAEAAVRQYFGHWESVSQNAAKNMDELSELAVKQGKGGAPGDPEPFQWHHFLRAADLIFTPEVMAEGRALLDEAHEAARGDDLAEGRVAFLEKGFRNVELTLAAQSACARYKETGEIEGYRSAISKLDEYRAEVEGDCIANMGFLAWNETREWDRSVLGTQ